MRSQNTMNKTVFMILNKKTGTPEGVYFRSYHNKYEFSSRDSALNANCHGIHKDESKYEIAEYEVSYKRIS